MSTPIRLHDKLDVARENEDEDVLIFEDADEFMSSPPPPMEVEDALAKIKEARQEMLQLRQRHKEIERQRQQIELIRQKQERFVSGKREIVEKLSRSIVCIERELYNTQKLVEELSAAYDIFNRHLDVIRTLQPEKWQRANVDEELDRAIEGIQEAQIDFVKCGKRLSLWSSISLEKDGVDQHQDAIVIKKFIGFLVEKLDGGGRANRLSDEDVDRIALKLVHGMRSDVTESNELGIDNQRRYPVDPTSPNFTHLLMNCFAKGKAKALAENKE